MNSMLLIASANEPLRLVKGDEAGSNVGWLVFALLGCVAVLALVWWGLSMHRSRVRRDEKEFVFRTVASSLRVSAPICALLRRLAHAHGSASPVGLLLSEHGLRTAIAAYERTAMPKGEQRLLERLRRDFGL